MTERIKIIGNRQTADGFEKAATFLDTVIALRGDRPFIPKGYYRFKTFEEAQDWSIRMMARPGRRRTDASLPAIALWAKAGRQTTDGRQEKREGAKHANAKK